MKALLVVICMCVVSSNSLAKSICDIGVATEDEVKQLEAKDDELSKLLASIERDGIESQKACNDLLDLKFDDFKDDADAIADLLNSQN